MKANNNGMAKIELVFRKIADAVSVFWKLVHKCVSSIIKKALKKLKENAVGFKVFLNNMKQFITTIFSFNGGQWYKQTITTETPIPEEQVPLEFRSKMKQQESVDITDEYVLVLQH